MEDLEGFKNHLKYLEGCCLQHPVDYQVEEIESVEAFEPAPQDGSGAALFKLKDGRYGAMNECQDYTGHG